MPPLNLLLKPASGACDLRCKYCFYTDEMSLREIPVYEKMSLTTLENVIQKALSTAERECTIAFQGGEPTLAGLDFFKTAVELQKKHNTRRLTIHNAIQTNGVSLDAEWADFFAKNRFLVGVSLDGPKEFHDRYRLDAAGKGTYARVMRATQLLSNHKVEYNVLSVVTRQSARSIGKVYGFMGRNGFDYQQYLTCMDPLETPGSEAYSLSGKEMGEYLCRLFDVWYADAVKGKLKYNRVFMNLLQILRGGSPESCNMMGHCNIQYVVEADGSVYPCDFYVLDQWRLGNLNTDTFAQLDDRRTQLAFIEKSLPVPEDCKVCQWYALCRNGCRRDREIMPDGTVGKNRYCEGWQAFYAYALPRLQNLARG